MYVSLSFCTQVPAGTQWQTIDQSYYRYYKNGDSNGFIHGFVHGLKYVVEPDGYAAMEVDAVDPLTASGAVLLQYSKYYFEYESAHRVAKEIVDRGSMTFSFTYSTSANTDSVNHWKRKTVETRPDGSTHTVYTNYIGQVMLSKSQSGSDVWVDYRRFDAEAHLIEQARPSAVLSYDDTAADLGITLRASAVPGRIMVKVRAEL